MSAAEEGGDEGVKRTRGSDRSECNARSQSLPHLEKRGPSESSSTMLSIHATHSAREGNAAGRGRPRTRAAALPFLPSFALTLKAVARTFAGYYLRAGEYGEMSCR